MSASLRNQRIRIYRYSDVGTNGVPDERYTFLAERWGRLTALGTKQVTIGGQAEHTVNAIAEFGDEVSVPQNGLLTLGTATYFVRGVVERPAVRAIEVLCEFCDDATPALVEA